MQENEEKARKRRKKIHDAETEKVVSQRKKTKRLEKKISWS